MSRVARKSSSSSQGWLTTIGLGLVAAVTYSANLREIGQYDTAPTTLTAYNLARGEGIYLDRFGSVIAEADGRLPAYVSIRNGHILSRYPLATALLAVPLYWPQVALIDRLKPAWERDPISSWLVAKQCGKHAATVFAALAVMALHRLLRRLELSAVAIPACLAAALGSDLWTVGSQALWQHGPAALMLTLAMLTLAMDAPSRRALLLGGTATAMLIACRSIDLLFAIVILAWVAWHHPRRLGWFLPAPAVIGTALVTYNLYYFGTLSGGLAELQALLPKVHRVPGPWSGDLREGMAGTLLSPARGLFVYCPWVALAVLMVPWSLRRLEPRTLAFWMVASLVAYLLMLSKYAAWWGGHTFGPRYWTDATPLLAILLALGLEWSRTRFRLGMYCFVPLVLAAVAFQVIGAFLFPDSTWNDVPVDVDQHHERLWDWSDNPITRCLMEWSYRRRD